MLGQPIAVPGFVDHHAHLLRAVTGMDFPATRDAIRAFHLRVKGEGSTPMDVPDELPDPADLPARLLGGLRRAAAAGLVEVTEMGMRDWAYADALDDLQQSGPLPVRVRVYLASGLAAASSLAELAARRNSCGPWVRLAGVKFYADGWLGPRTCAMCQPFGDAGSDGVLFLTGEDLARRAGPLIENGWQIATHAIGDRAVAEVLTGYDLAWGGDHAAMASAAPRIEHASLLSADLIARMAEGGVIAGIQPSFATTDVQILGPALGTGRAGLAYPWASLAAAGVRMLAGSDYPIEVVEPLAGLARLVTGRSLRPGFEPSPAELLGPAQARLPAGVAFAAMTDETAGQTLLTADPRLVAPPDIDAIEVTGTEPVPWPS